MSYRINVAARHAQPGWDGQPQYTHLFDTTLESFVDAQLVATVITERFPAPLFRVTFAVWETSGKDLTLAQLNRIGKHKCPDCGEYVHPSSLVRDENDRFICQSCAS